ncbi:hypothetical protein [Erwinia psidii]|uniref:hypothetical protein n=1 Tax=Erwinia psidii TaxID=69224 RepID=UPI00226B8E40|nr:hypothetical protein [Erwinia psidii]
MDNNKIFDFIHDVYSMDVGNPVEPFETVEDITRYLREQWAGLFQRLLITNSRKLESELISDIKNSGETLRSLVNVLVKERKNPAQVSDILMLYHPAFEAIKKAANITYRVVFYNLDELSSLLSARGYILDEDFSPEGYYDFDNNKSKKCIRVDRDVFENGALKVMLPTDWKNQFVRVVTFNPPSDDDDAPF